jgi:hypothetical protein
MKLTSVLRALVAGFALHAIGCTSNGVGDPCLPPQPSSSATTAAAANCGDDAGCFLGSELYVETRAVECRTRVCLVNHWDQVSAPQERSERTYCTCRCDGPGDPATLCDCPDGFRCLPVFAIGETAVQGSYCVRRGP